MIPKSPVTLEDWPSALAQGADFLLRHEGFLLAGYPDADALGTMLSLALYLKTLGKRPYIVWPGPLIGKTDFLEDILQHNRVPLVARAEGVAAFTGRVEALIFCDTANSKLVPFYRELETTFLHPGRPVLELDHHFGTDSEPIHSRGLHLFRRSNSTTEIAAELLEACFRRRDAAPDPFEQRNIVVSLLTGLIADTGGGNASVERKDYEYWIRRLGERLTLNTRPPHPEREAESPHFTSPDEIRQFLSRLSDIEKQGVTLLQEKIVQDKSVGRLDLLDATRLELMQRLRLNPTAWAQILETMANAIPEIAGGLGFLYFKDKTAEGEDCYYIKMRRAQETEFDLRETGEDVREAFGPDQVLGGGGHPCAVSFRIRLMGEAEFLRGIETLTQRLRSAGKAKPLTP